MAEYVFRQSVRIDLANDAHNLSLSEVPISGFFLGYNVKETDHKRHRWSFDLYFRAPATDQFDASRLGVPALRMSQTGPNAASRSAPILDNDQQDNISDPQGFLIDIWTGADQDWILWAPDGERVEDDKAMCSHLPPSTSNRSHWVFVPQGETHRIGTHTVTQDMYIGIDQAITEGLAGFRIAFRDDASLPLIQGQGSSVKSASKS